MRPLAVPSAATVPSMSFCLRLVTDTSHLHWETSGNPYADAARATGTTTLASEVQLRVMVSGQSV
jgi:hypothetical protein